MAVELPAALKTLGLGAIRTREDANAYALGICRISARSCGTDATADECRRALATYGLGDAGDVPTPTALLFDAARVGAQDTVARLLAEGADPDARHAAGWTALMIAAAERHQDTVTVLLQGRADPNLRNLFGRTALMYAASYGQTGIVERLLAAGADPDIVPDDSSGWTALIAAAARGHAGTVERLLRHGADAAIRSRDGRTALDIARQEGHVEVELVFRTASAVKG